eukprot:2072858-Lingulodinium_polyedra.AAC.1
MTPAPSPTPWPTPTPQEPLRAVVCGPESVRGRDDAPPSVQSGPGSALRRYRTLRSMERSS